MLEIGEEFIRKHPDQSTRQAEYTRWFRENKAFLWPFDRYKYIDDEGIYTGSQSVHNPGKEGYRYDVIHPITQKPCVQPLMGYRFPPETMNRLLEEERVLFGNDENKIIELKVYVKDHRAKLSSLFELDGRIGTYELKEIFPDDKRPFDFPKPTELIEELISFTTSNDDLVMDSFAGSGTTAHAVMKLNKADEQNRRFILVEMKPSIARELTSERVRRVAKGYKNKKGEHVEGLGGGFRYCQLSGQLFDERGKIRESVRFSELARHVYFTETGEPLPREHVPNSSHIGTHHGAAIFLLYNGILKDKTPNGGNVLTSKVLGELTEHNGPRVIYGTACRIGAARLRKEGVVFKQLPYKLRIEAP